MAKKEAAEMIKVLLADDELIVRKGLIATVDWAKFNMEVIADAPNGQKAWELFQEHSPEVVITDIVMPEMNGIELARKIKHHSPAVKILLLSCHRDFSYAQEGMNIGASGYILKTAFQDQQFEEYLERFENELANTERNQTSTYIEKEFYEWLCGFKNSFLELLEEKFLKDWEWMQRPFSIFYLNGLNNREYLHKKWPVGEKQFTKIHCGQDQAFIFIPETFKEEFEHLLVEARTKDAAIRWNANGPNQGINEWMDGVSALYRQLKFENQFNIYMKDWPAPIQKAVQIIVEHLHESLPSTFIANEVGLSRSHFSTMFKKTVGESFISFTEKLKIQAACDLLKNTSLTLQEIGEKIGIQDGKYFSKWFKKCIGVSPSDYRQNKKANIS